MNRGSVSRRRRANEAPGMKISREAGIEKRPRRER